MIERLGKEEFLNIKQVNDLFKRFKKNDEEEKKRKCMTWVWVALGVATVAAGAFALYKLLAPNEFEEFEEEDFEEFEEFEEEDFEDMDYEEDDSLEDQQEETEEEPQSEEV